MLILASASPRRRELLSQIGVAYMVNPSTYEEDVPKKKDPAKFVLAQALGKANDVSAKYPGQWVLGADTVVALDGEILGKPKHEKMLSACSRSCPTGNIPYLRGWHWYGVKRLTRKWWKPRSGSGS